MVHYRSTYTLSFTGHLADAIKIATNLISWTTLSAQCYFPLLTFTIPCFILPLTTYSAIHLPLYQLNVNIRLSWAFALGSRQTQFLTFSLDMDNFWVTIYLWTIFQRSLIFMHVLWMRHQFLFVWTILSHVCTANDLGAYRQCLPPEEGASLPTALGDGDNIFL